MSHLDNVPPTVFALPRSQWGPRDNGLNWPAPPGYRNYRPPHRDKRCTNGELAPRVRLAEDSMLPALSEDETPPCCETCEENAVADLPSGDARCDVDTPFAGQIAPDSH